MGSLDWHVTMLDIHLQRLVDPLSWTCWNQGEMTEQLDWWEKSSITTCLGLGIPEVLRSLRQYLREKPQRHHAIDRLGKRGVEKGIGRQSTLKGRERIIVMHQFNIERIVSKATLETPERRGGAHMGYPERLDSIWNWTGLKWTQPPLNSTMWAKMHLSLWIFDSWLSLQKSAKPPSIPFENLPWLWMKWHRIQSNALQSFEQAKGAIL